MKVLVIGDTHNDLAFVQDCIVYCTNELIDTIVQLGDCGFAWPSRNKVTELQAALADAGIQMYFLEGNHDNYDDLRSRGIYQQPRPMPYGTDAPNITYLPRGCTFQLDGVDCMAFGGAISIDKAGRREHTSWWHEEAITNGDVLRAIENAGGKDIKVMFTHDAPLGIEWLEENLQAFNLAKALDTETSNSRLAVRAVVDQVKPKLLFHGHYHVGHRHKLVLNTYLGTSVQVIGLAHNEWPTEATYVLDLATFKEL